MSQSTVKRQLKKVQINYQSPRLSGGVLHLDVTYWGRNKGLIVALDASSGRVVYHKWIAHESKQDYLDALTAIRQTGYQVKAVVLDGGVGLAIASDQVKVQLCQYHFISIIRRKLTLRPKLQASQELLSLVKSIVYLPKEKFIELFTEWQKQWRNFLKEKTVNEETKRWQYTHKSLRSASLSVQKFLSILFTYQDYPELEIPNTNNAVEGFFTALKTALRNHNGLSQENKERFVEGFFRHRDIARLTNKAQKEEE